MEFVGSGFPSGFRRRICTYRCGQPSVFLVQLLAQAPARLARPTLPTGPRQRSRTCRPRDGRRIRRSERVTVKLDVAEHALLPETEDFRRIGADFDDLARTLDAADEGQGHRIDAGTEHRMA